MNLIKNSYICGSLIVLIATVNAADVPDQERYEKVFSDTIAKINNGLKTRHIADLVTAQRGGITSEITPLRQQPVIEVSSNPQINVQILPKSFQIVSFYREIPATGLGSYDAPPKPKWTTDQAINEAKAWFESVIGPIPKTAGSPVAEYTPGSNPPKYYDGQWEVRWPRSDGRGHLFTQDTITINLNEKYGVASIFNNFVSDAADGQKVLVSKDQAIDIGRPVAQKLLSGPLAADWSKGLSLLPSATAELWVVNPNHILQYKTPEDLASAKGDTTARLAWVVTYRASNGSMGSDIDVWIDTETKEAIGGDFK